MALPKLNTVTYDLTLPSTGQKLEYRPFLVKEQKALMIAQESGDDKQIEKAFNEQTWDVGYHNEYTSEVQIYLLDRKDQRRYGVRLHEAYPRSIGAVDLNQAPSSEIIKLPITFSYRWWETLDITRQPPNLKEKIFSTVINTVERNISRNIPSVLNKLGR